MELIDEIKLGHKLSAMGSLLAGGSVAAALASELPPDAPDCITHYIHIFSMGTIIIGAMMSCAGKLLVAWATEDPLNDK